MLDKSFRLLFRNFSTLFLVGIVVTGTLHLIHSYVFRNAIEVRELHDDIESFPPGRKVRSVGRNELADYGNTRTAVMLLEIALIPLFVGATRRVLEVDDDNGVPGVIDAWAHCLTHLPRPRRGFVAGTAGAVLSGLGVALAVGWLGERIALELHELAPDRTAWAVLGLSVAGARAAAATFFVIPLAVGLRGIDDGTTAAPQLY